jgi:branched-chain amino acid transport system permease protein
MNQDAAAKLEGVFARHGPELFSKPRVAEIIRENLGSECKLESSLLNAAIQVGIPQRLLAAEATIVTPRMLTNLAADMSSRTGTKEELSAWAVEVWAKALGLVLQPRANVNSAAESADKLPSQESTPSHKNNQMALGLVLQKGRDTRIALMSCVFLFVVAISMPLLLSNLLVFQFTQMLVYAIVILGLNLLTGINAEFSLLRISLPIPPGSCGHSAFFALGAYTAAILMKEYSVINIWTVPAAGVVCFLAGFLFGLPALRFEGIYLALATFALAIATPQILQLSLVEHSTGGGLGITIGHNLPSWLPLRQDQWLYYFTLGVALILYVLARYFVKTGTFIPSSDIPPPPSMDLNPSAYKSLGFGISALYTGIAGALSAIAMGFVAPDLFTPVLSIAFLVGFVFGGVGWLPGGIFGGAFVLLLSNIVEWIFQSTALIGWAMNGVLIVFYSLILILLIYLMPRGVGGFVRALLSRSKA